MQQEKYSLSWESYSDHLKSMMREMMMNEDYSDVTLVTEDKKEIKANINILCAVSPVFKEILKKGKNSSTLMYLRGIQHSEMESIMQFIYYGEATLYEDRIDELLGVAKSLEIKELCRAKGGTIDSSEDKPALSDQGQPNENSVKQTSYDIDQASPSKEGCGVRKENEQDQSQKTFSCPSGSRNQKRSVQEGIKSIKHACDQCDQHFSQQCNLTRHKLSVHEGVRFKCDHCDYQATQKSWLKKHNQSIHEGFKYACDQCDYQAKKQVSIKLHIIKFHTNH